MVPLMSLRQYTTHLQHVMVIAEEEAIAGNASAISTGHMLLGMLRERGCVAARALTSLGITAEAVSQSLAGMSLPAEDGPSSYGISRRITFTKWSMGILSNTRAQLPETGHAGEGQKRPPEGGVYLCTGEILLAMIDIARGAVIGENTASAIQLLARFGIDLPGAYEQVLDMVRRSPADESDLGA
jgi:Clp amino terminal domain, pathogenicity island component